MGLGVRVRGLAWERLPPLIAPLTASVLEREEEGEGKAWACSQEGEQAGQKFFILGVTDAIKTTLNHFSNELTTHQTQVASSWADSN